MTATYPRFVPPLAGRNQASQPLFTLAALRASLKKWEEIVAGYGVDLGPRNCALCYLFNPGPYRFPVRDCEGCPVKEATGLPFCEGTPYEDWSQLPGAPSPLSEYLNSDHREHHDRALALAQAEADFLRSLLPGAEG